MPWDLLTGGMHGSVQTTNGRLFVLEFCGRDGGHVWKEWDTTAFGEDHGVKVNDDDLINDDIRSSSLLLQDRVATDNTTMVTYSVKVYLTPEFAAETPDVEGFVAQALAETNQAYRRKRINTEEKAKVVASASELILFVNHLGAIHPIIQIVLGKTASALRN